MKSRLFLFLLAAALAAPSSRAARHPPPHVPPVIIVDPAEVFSPIPQPPRFWWVRLCLPFFLHCQP